MFLNPLGLLALLGVPAVVALHLFRRRFQRRQVSALFLWEARQTTTLAGRRRERLLRSPSFWCEVLLALLLGLAFAGPRGCGSLEAKHLVVVLDGSASMAAGSANDPSAAEQAVERISAAIDALPSGSRVTVVESGPVPHIVVGPAAFPQEAVAHLAGFTPIAGRHDLGPAAALALEVAGDGAVTLYTDRFTPEALPDEVGVVALGKPRENVAITRAARLVAEDGAAGEDDVFLTVTNYAGRPRSVDVVVLGEAGTVAEQALSIAPDTREHLSFRLPAGLDGVEVRLDGDDFPIDDAARLAPAPRRELALFTDLGEEERRRLGLQRSSEAPLAQWLALVPRSRRADDAASAHLVITTSAPAAAGVWALELARAAGEPLDLIGPFLIEKRHPAADGVLLDGVVWSAVDGVALPGVPIVSAGNLPLLTEEDLGDRRVFHMNIDWARSTLQRSPDWPILLANLAELRRGRLDGPLQTNLGVGEVFVFRSRAPADYELEGPDGLRELRAVSTLEIDDLRLPGDYVLSSGGEERARFAVHFADDAESDLRRSSAGERTSTVELGEERSGSSWVVLLLAVGALGAVLVDWWVLRPRGPAAFEPGGRA